MSDLPPTNTIDALMGLDPLSLTTENIDSIIAYHRKARSNAASGIKAKKEKGPGVDISGLVLKMTQGESAAPKSGGGIRRR